MKPYYADDTVTLYHGDMRNLVPELTLQADLVLADPPYGETSLVWDRWPDGWLAAARAAAPALWCFGSLRTFGVHYAEFLAAGWRLSQDVIGHDEDDQPVYGDVEVAWEKQNGSGFTTDRFKRVHEWASHWYQDSWADTYHEVPRTDHLGPRVIAVRGKASTRGEHLGGIGESRYEDHGTRLMRSVIKIRNMHKRAIHPTEKPVGLLDPLIRYACPPGAVVLDPFAGSGSTGEAARLSGRRAVLIEGNERYCELAARRLSQEMLPLGAGTSGATE